MSIRGLYNDTMDILRYTSSSVDGGGQPVKTWSTLQEDEPCRLFEMKGGREALKDRQVVISKWTLYSGYEGLKESDRVTINSTTYEIFHVVKRFGKRRFHHNESTLVEVKAD